MHTYNLRIRTIGPDGFAVTGWYIADGYNLSDALTEAILQYGLRGTYQSTESHKVLR